jgi:RHS repeat-associated protein
LGYFPELTSTTNKDYLNSNASITTFVYNYNASGNLSTKSTSFGWVGQPNVKTTQSAFNYVLNNGYYKLQNHTTTQTQNGQLPYARTVQYNYDTQGHLTSVISDPTFGNNMLTTAYGQFTPFGQAKTTTISASDIIARTSELVFDATGRFVVKKTNAITDFTEYIYEPKYGNVVSSKNITGLETRYFYDGLGRLTKTILPNNAENKVTYAWDNPSNYAYDNGLSFGIYSVKTDIEANSYSKKYLSSNEEVLRVETQDCAGQTVVTDTKYNLGINFVYPQGAVLETTEPHYLNQQKYLITKADYETTYFRPFTSKTYSVNGSSVVYTGLFEQNSYNTPSTDLAYNTPFVTTINQNNQQINRIANAAGQTATIQNTYVGTQQNAFYTFDSNGNPKTITVTNSGNNNQSFTETFSYNNLGQKISLTDPSLGTTTYSYNTLGELLIQTDLNGNTAYTYDALGRTLSKTGNLSGTTTYQYVATGNGKEGIDKVYGPNSLTEYKYNNYSQLVEQKETIGSKVFKTSTVLDNYGRVIAYTYPSGFSIKKQYNSFGYLTAINDANNQSIWQLTTSDALNRTKEFVYGNGIVTKNKYNDLNFLYEIDHGNGSIHKQEYSFNAFTGNVTERVFHNYVNNVTLKETFGFDALDRLTQTQQLDYSSNNIIQTNNTTFDNIGNVTAKTDAATQFVYGNLAAPFTITQLNNATANVLLTNVNYTDFDKVSQISEASTNKQMDFMYGTSSERLKMNYTISGINQFTRYYAENYDREETSGGYKEWNYIFAPSGLCAVYFNNNGAKQLNYVLNDHLGSPILLTNNNQQVIEKYSFDSWGRRRNPSDWSYANLTLPQYMIRGYTLHEHLDELNLINMNGRIYDPVLGRFIHADCIIQSPDNMQNYNRFSYCLNNPLKFTDLSGYDYEIPIYIAAPPAATTYGGSSYSYGYSNNSGYGGNNTSYGGGYSMSSGGNYNYGGQTVNYSISNSSSWSYGTSYSPQSITTWGEGTTSYGVQVSVGAYGYEASATYGYSYSFSQPNYAYQAAQIVAQGGGGTDLTSQFNQRIGGMEATFGAVGSTMNSIYGGPILSYPAKFAAFGYMQYKGAKTEFMNPKAFKTSPFYNGGLYNGEHFSADDFGNYAYGVAARAMGILSIDAVQGAGIYSIYTHSPTTDWTNFYGFFDERKDTRMILRGYYGK